MIPDDQLDVGRLPGQLPAPVPVPQPRLVSALELEKLRAAQARILEELNAPPPSLELERLRAEEVRIRGEIDRLTQTLDVQIEKPAEPTQDAV